MGDGHLAQEMLHGRYILAGKTLIAGSQSPFTADPPSIQWEMALHNFRWLRHLREDSSLEGEALARRLVADWMRVFGRNFRDLAWEPDITARRCIAWMQHSTTLLKNADLAFYEEFLRSLAMQLRYLRAMSKGMVGGEEKLRCSIALAFGALSLPASQGRQNAATRNLERDLDDSDIAGWNSRLAQS